jgi:hypothetical protein
VRPLQHSCLALYRQDDGTLRHCREPIRDVVFCRINMRTLTETPGPRVKSGVPGLCIPCASYYRHGASVSGDMTEEQAGDTMLAAFGINVNQETP